MDDLGAQPTQPTGSLSMDETFADNSFHPSESSSTTAPPFVADATPKPSSIRSGSRLSIPLAGAEADGRPTLQSSVVAQWRQAIGKALSKCKKIISPEDYVKIQGFKSLDELLKDIEEREEDHIKRRWLPIPKFTISFASQIFPALQALSTTASFFMTTVHSSETAVMWGVLYLMITLSVERERNWNDFIHRLERIRCSLVIVNQCTMWFEHEKDEERLSVMSAAILTVFVNILDFWIEAVQWLSKHAYASKADFLPLNESFDRKMENIEFAIKHLTQVATLYHKLENRTTMQGHTELVKNVQMETDTIEYPFKYLPEPEYKGFFGRENTFSQLSAHLNPSVIREARSVLVCGIGGVGKTKLCITWAHRSSFDAVFFVQAETKDSLRASFTKIAVALHLPGAGLSIDAEQNLLYFQGWLRTQASRGPDGRSWLMVFDNCEDIADLERYLPTTPGSVLISSRYSAAKLDDSLVIQLEPLNDDESIKLLMQLAKWNLAEEKRAADTDALPDLLKTVAGLPLGIKTLAALMNARQKSAADFLPFYKKHAKNLLKDVNRITDYDKDKSRVVGRDHVLYNIFQLSFKSLQDQAYTFIGIMACLSPEDIPLDLFSGFEAGQSNRGSSPLLDICFDEYNLDKMILELRGSSLVTQQGDMISFHRVIKEAYLFCQPPSKIQEVFNIAVLLVSKAFPEQVNGRPMYEDRIKCETYIQHALALSSLVDPRLRTLGSVKLKAPAELAEMLKSCAWHLYETGQLKSTLDLLEVAFCICESKESLLYAHLCNTAACCYFDLNDLVRGRSYAKEALEIRKKSPTASLPEEEEDLANSYNNFGNFDCATEEYDAATANFQRCEEIRVRLGKGLIIPLAILHLNFGRMLCRQRNFSKALARYRDAEKIFFEVLGQDVTKWPELAAGVSMLYGTIESEMNNSATAVTYFEKSKTILEESAPYHISLASVCYKLASENMKQGKLRGVADDLRKAYSLADFVGAEGEKARIMRKQAQFLLLSGNEDDRKESLRLQEAADYIRINLPGEMRHVFEDSDRGWNRLVCSFYR